MPYILHPECLRTKFDAVRLNSTWTGQPFQGPQFSQFFPNLLCTNLSFLDVVTNKFLGIICNFHTFFATCVIIAPTFSLDLITFLWHVHGTSLKFPVKLASDQHFWSTKSLEWKYIRRSKTFLIYIWLPRHISTTMFLQNYENKYCVAEPVEKRATN